MKKIFLIFLTTFLFFGCSGKTQINKIPNGAKWHLPNIEEEKPKINVRYISEYEEYVADFFRQSIGTNSGLRKCSESQNEIDIYGVGLRRGHFND